MNTVIQITAAIVLTISCQGIRAAEFHVSPAGDDGNPGTKDKPFATLQRARDEIRRFKSPEGATVLLRGGLYSMPQGIVFEKQDSGTEDLGRGRSGGQQTDTQVQAG